MDINRQNNNKNRYRRKKSRRAKTISVLALAGILLMVCLGISFIFQWALLKVFAVAVILAAVGGVMRTFSGGKKKRKIKPVRERKSTVHLKETEAYTIQPGDEAKFRRSPGEKKKNYNWVVDTKEVKNNLRSEKKDTERPKHEADASRHDIKLDVAKWSSAVNYSASVFRKILQKDEQEIENKLSEDDKDSDGSEDIAMSDNETSYSIEDDGVNDDDDESSNSIIDTVVENDEDIKEIEDTVIDNYESVYEQSLGPREHDVQKSSLRFLYGSNMYDVQNQEGEYMEKDDEGGDLGETNSEPEQGTGEMSPEIEVFPVPTGKRPEKEAQNKVILDRGQFRPMYKQRPIHRDLKEKSYPAGMEKKVGSQGTEHSSKRVVPPVELLGKQKNDTNAFSTGDEASKNAVKLIATLESFGVKARILNVSRGPAVTRYELQPDYGVKVSKIVNLTDDIALNLAATGVRIEAPIPGKAAIGIEVPNKEINAVLIRDVIESEEFIKHPSKIAFAVGKDVTGNTVVADIAKMPHLLIAGATGAGKSVCINTLIASILYKASPEEVKLLMVDPKVVELSVYNGIPHLLIPVVTDPKKAAGALNWAVQEMTNRYKFFAENNVRDLTGYNLLMKGKEEGKVLPRIVIIIDELADLMMVAPNDVEDCICRLAQMARAAGMHLVIATQRPSVDVITGVIKANIPSRISFAVSSQIDSRTILDMAGAEKLLGRGDMLFNPLGKSKPVRVQGALITDKEVEGIVSFLKARETAQYDEEVLEKIDTHAGTALSDNDEDDGLLPQVIEMILEQGQASTSLIQRKFKVGYSRAARMLDQLEQNGIVGHFEGSKPRKVLISKNQWQEEKDSWG